MEIRPTSEGAILAAQLSGVLADLERRVDKTVIQPFTITSDAMNAEASEALIEDKREIADVEQTLKPFADLAWNIHRTITGKRGELSSYAKARAEIRDAAITERAREALRKQQEEDARLKEVARKDAEARQKAEADELARRAKEERRPDLAQRAKEIAVQPIREIAITSARGGGAMKARTRGSDGGSVGLLKKFVVEVTDEEALIIAAGRPAIYREAIDMLLKEFGKKKGGPIVEPLRARLEDLPQIPFSVLEPVEQRLKEVAKATDGKMNWPGVAVSEDFGTSVRK